MHSVITEESIKTLVNTFYDKVRADQQLGPVFDQAIAEGTWPEHLETMCDFWSSVMLKTGRYHGNPAVKHLNIPAFDASLFDRWLELFSETAGEVFPEGEAAAEFEGASRNIARSLKFMLYGKA